VLIDARCTLDKDAWENAGWIVQSPGRPAETGSSWLTGISATCG